MQHYNSIEINVFFTRFIIFIWLFQHILFLIGSGVYKYNNKNILKCIKKNIIKKYNKKRKRIITEFQLFSYLLFFKYFKILDFYFILIFFIFLFL